MRYEIIPDNYQLVTVCNDIPNNAYLYSNTLSANQMAIIKKQEGQYIQLNMSSKINTLNTKLNLLLNRNPNDEIYIIDQRSKSHTCNAITYKMDINNCNVCFSMNASFTLRITNPITFIEHYVDYYTNTYLYAIARKIENIFQSTLNEKIIDGYELITSGIQLNEFTKKIKYEIEHLCHYYGMELYLDDLQIKINNFNEISEFYRYDMNFNRKTKEHIITRLIDTIFNQYSNNEVISDNQVRILEKYLDNAIIENTNFNIEEITTQFSKMSKTFTFKDLIDNLDQVNKRLSNTRYLEDK